MASVGLAESIRQKGNEHYKAGDFEAAKIKYEEAVRLVPSDPTPLSNVSAVCFELGDYASAISAAEQAMSLLDDQTKKQKLCLRMAKCQLLLRDYAAGQRTIKQLADTKESQQLSRSINTFQRSQTHVENSAAVHTKLIMEIPRFKKQIHTTPEYFVFGHDQPESLYDSSLAQTGRNKISLMLGGIGDARHLLASLASIRVDESSGRIASGKQFHFTIVDHKPAVIARDLLILLFFLELSDILNKRSPGSQSQVQECLYYLYLAPIMPPGPYLTLQGKIEQAIDLLGNRKPMPSVIDVPSIFRESIIKVLREWQLEAEQAFPVSELRPSIVKSLRQARAAQIARFGQERGAGVPPPPGCEKMSLFYHKTGLLLLSAGDEGHPQGIEEAYTAFDVSRPNALDKAFLEDVDTTWKTNVTMIDMEKERDHAKMKDADVLAHDPFDFGQCAIQAGLALPHNGGLYQLLFLFFFGVADALNSLRDRLKLEICLGDVTCVLEQIRLGIVGHRQREGTSQECSSQDIGGQSALACQDYPKLFDRIHLSNIPDYIGGSLSTLTYALPLVHVGKDSFVTCNCLRNPPRFKTHAHYNNEYLAISSASDLRKAFEAVMGDIVGWRAQNPFILTEYIKWHRDPLPKTSANLLSRQQLETWLVRLFFKIVIPKEREPINFTLIESPLNLTAFIRLCGHLQTVGYPAHWLNSILDSICSGSVTTRARPPRSDPLKIKEVREELAALTQSTNPFVAELTTLMSLWQFALPFGYLSPALPIDQVHKYTIRFDDVDDTAPEVPSFVLVLFSARYLIQDIKSIRPFLLDDELGDKSERGRLIREHIHNISTWDWDWSTKTATFWLRHDVIDKLRSSPDWAIAIWRTDVWTYQAMPQFTGRIQDHGPFWQG